ncbi:ATP-dependent carboxylate-amine ligase [Mycobacterium haemophilum DSM 44634]
MSGETALARTETGGATATGCSVSRLLVLTNKPIVHRLPEWFPNSRSEVVLVSTPAALAASGLDNPDAHFRHVHSVSGFADPSLEEELFQLCRQFGVERILSTGEREVLPAARLRERLGLPGIDVPTATAFRDKFVMKSLVAAAGLPVAPMRRVDDVAALRDFAAEVGYPVLVKPLDRGGSAGIQVLGDADDLEAVIGGRGAAAWCAPMLAEAWIAGDFYQVNGLMDDGVVVLGQPCYNPYSDWFTVAFSVPAMSGMLPETDPLAVRLRAATGQVLAALPPVPGVCAFHAEFFHTPEDRLVLGEIACRAGGADIVNIHEAVLGVNLHGASLLGQAGRRAPLHYATERSRQGFAYFPPARGVLRDIPVRCPLPNVLTYSVTGECGRSYGGADARGPTVAKMTFTLSTSDVRAELRQIEQWWERNTVWENRTSAVPNGAARLLQPAPDEEVC